jgi:hypothetical protein
MPESEDIFNSLDIASVIAEMLHENNRSKGISEKLCVILETLVTSLGKFNPMIIRR